MKSWGYLSVNQHLWVHEHWLSSTGVPGNGAMRARWLPVPQPTCVDNRSHNSRLYFRLRSGEEQNMWHHVYPWMVRTTDRDPQKGDRNAHNQQNIITWLYSCLFTLKLVWPQTNNSYHLLSSNHMTGTVREYYIILLFDTILPPFSTT